MKYTVFAGRKGDSDTWGIHSYIYDNETSTLEWRRREDDLREFTHLAISPNGCYMAATGKDEQNEDILVLYSIAGCSNEIRCIGHVRMQTSGDVCHLEISHDSTAAVVTDFVNKGIHVYRIGNDDSPVSFVKRVSFQGSSTSFRQGSTHLHSAFFSMDDQYILVSDLGANRIWVVRWDRETDRFETVDAWKGRDGIGQRHLCMHPNGKNVYSLSEITAEIAALELQPDGTLKQISMQSAMDQPLPNYAGQPLTALGLPPNYIAAGDIVISPDGKYVFASIRMIREISVFGVMPDGNLMPICFARSQGTPRCLRISRDSHVLFAFDEESSFTGGKGMIEVFCWDECAKQLSCVASQEVSGMFVGSVLPET